MAGPNPPDLGQHIPGPKHCQFHCIRHETNKVLEDFISEKSQIADNKLKEYDRFI